MNEDYLIEKSDLVLVTGATGFIGRLVVQRLVEMGFRHVRCFVRPSTSESKLADLSKLQRSGVELEVVKGNLQSREDCIAATRNVRVIFHLAAGRGEKHFPDAFVNSVVTTRNLLEAVANRRCLRRFVNVSSFSVYSNSHKTRGRLLDETCPVEERAHFRGEAYCFAKVEQDRIVAEYGKKFEIPYIIVRPGQVYGPGNEGITGRVGIDTFGIFLHLGGSNTVPITYVENCAEAIVLAGLKNGNDGEVFNIVDDDLPSSRRLLQLYKQHVGDFRSIYVPHFLSYALCALWEEYSIWSEEQLPLAFNRRRWHAYWKKTLYTNEKLKTRVGWTPRVRTEDGLRYFFESCKKVKARA